MFIAPILSVFIAVTIFFLVATKIRSKGYGKDFEAYVNEEREANAIKNKPISADDLFSPDMSLFPVLPDDGGHSRVTAAQRDVVYRSKKKMMRFDPPMTNLELKHKYGSVNLELVCEYEESFHAFTDAVNEWAEALLEAHDESGAELVLRGGIANGAEKSKTYIMLAELYFKNGRRDELRTLRDTAESKHMPGRDKALRHIDDCLEKLGL